MLWKVLYTDTFPKHEVSDIDKFDSYVVAFQIWFSSYVKCFLAVDLSVCTINQTQHFAHRNTFIIIQNAFPFEVSCFRPCSVKCFLTLTYSV